MCGYYFKGSLICPKLKRLCLWSILNQVIETLFQRWSRDQGDLRTAKINRSRRHCCNLTLNHWKSNNQARFLTMKNLDPSCKSLKQATTSNFPLPFHYWTTVNETIKIFRMWRSNAILHWSGFLSYPSSKQARCDCSWNNLASKHSHVIARYIEIYRICVSLLPCSSKAFS